MRIKQKNQSRIVSVVLFAERVSAKRHSLICRTEDSFCCNGARLRAPTIIRRTNINHIHQRKKTPEGVISLVEVVGVAPLAARPAPMLLTSSFANG